MQGLRMVPVLRVANAFHARVVAARLGSEGIVTTFRGSVDGPYPMGAVEVLVDRGDLEMAKEILLADEVESAFDGDGDGDDQAVEGDDGFEAAAPVPRRPQGPWVLGVVVVLLALFAVAHTLRLA